MSSIRERNAPRNKRRSGRETPSVTRPEGPSAAWFWGWHAVLAALENSDREPPQRILATAERAADLARRFPGLVIESVDTQRLANLLPGAVHQGVALRPGELPTVDLQTFAPVKGAEQLLLGEMGGGVGQRIPDYLNLIH